MKINKLNLFFTDGSNEADKTFPDKNRDFFIRMKLHSKRLLTKEEKKVNVNRILNLLTTEISNYGIESIILSGIYLTPDLLEIVSEIYIELVCYFPHIKFSIDNLDIVKNVQLKVNNIY